MTVQPTVRASIAANGCHSNRRHIIWSLSNFLTEILINVKEFRGMSFIHFDRGKLRFNVCNT